MVQDVAVATVAADGAAVVSTTQPAADSTAAPVLPDLFVACRAADLDRVHSLLLDGAQVNMEVGCHTPLMIAAKFGHLPIVKLLCAAGASRLVHLSRFSIDIEQQAYAWKSFSVRDWLAATRGYTPLHIALTCGYSTPVLTRMLLRRGASLSLLAGDTPKAADGSTVLDAARTLAREERRAGVPRSKTVGGLVLDAADGWTPLKHGLFPAETKARVVELLQLGYQLRQRTGLVFDVWLGEIIPSLVRLEAKAGH